jgi:uncharacterized membrane protein
MQQQSYLLIVISTIILFNSVFADADQEAACANQTNTDCHTCLSVSNCAFCNDNKKCFYYYENMLQPPCNTSQLQLGTCVVAFRVWIIIVAVIGGIVLLAILIAVCCLCRKCKQCRNRKLERRIARNDQQMEERRAAAEVRSAERTRVADQIRMKYGILKEKDAVTDYSRMS